MRTQAVPRDLDFFSDDYREARQRLRAALTAAGASHEALIIDARGPQGEDLGIDIAWLGDPAARRVVLHSSGLHGVEGFAGSAIQLKVLADPPAFGRGTALVLAHALNPFGMAWLRRANESNVDLNRNFILDDDGFTGAPERYRRLDAVLNPRSPPRVDGFALRAVASILRHGYGPLKRALAEGQYEFPLGLFYGGARLEAGPRGYCDWLAARLGAVERVVAIDVHTGLGPARRETLFLETRGAGGDAGAVAAAISRRLVAVTEGMTGGGYANRGGYGAALPRLLPRAEVDFITQEFGTVPALVALRALRDENRWHHWGDGGIAHASKRRLRAAFCPQAPAWRRAVLTQGAALLHDACRYVFSDHGSSKKLSRRVPSPLGRGTG
ncbi:MAG TPA: DUF2817 domain-containing protein [Acidiferrobacterales bacterium]